MDSCRFGAGDAADRFVTFMRRLDRITSPRDGRRFSVLVVSHSYPPVLGGSEVEAQRVCSALLRRGHTVTVLCSGGPPMPDVSFWTDPAGVPVRIFGRHRLARDYAFALGVARTLFRERRRYQIVYLLMQGLHLAAGLPVARLLGKPVVMKVSGSGITTSMRGSWLGRLELRFLRRWARRVMILNPGMAEEAAAAGLDPDRLLWMPNPVDTDEFAPPPTRSTAASCAPGSASGLPRRWLFSLAGWRAKRSWPR